MSQKIAVAIIHGVGDQGADFADSTISMLTEAFAEHFTLDNKSVDDKLVFTPIYWANVVGRKQRILWNTVEDDADLNFHLLRKFFMHFGGDGIAYQPGASRRQVYDQIHQTVADALSYLANEAGPEAPLCIIGHSIGTVVIHNYFFDLARNVATGSTHSIIDTALERGETFSLLYTLGSPLAIWSLRYDDYQPIDFPGNRVNNLYPKLNPKWTNYFDKDDIIAYPIRSLSKKHREMAKRGLLQDVHVDSGSILKSWNPLSHTAYWVDDSVIKPIAKDLFDAWHAVN